MKFLFVCRSHYFLHDVISRILFNILCLSVDLYDKH